LVPPSARLQRHESWCVGICVRSLTSGRIGAVLVESSRVQMFCLWVSKLRHHWVWSLATRILHAWFARIWPSSDAPSNFYRMSADLKDDIIAIAFQTLVIRLTLPVCWILSHHQLWCRSDAHWDIYLNAWYFWVRPRRPQRPTP